MPARFSVSDAFEGGNVEFVKQSVDENNGWTKISVKVKPDVYTELEKIAHMQYFSFRVTVSDLETPEQVTYVIENAAACSYPVAWQGTTVFVSADKTDSESWTRNSTTKYVDGQLTWTHLHETSGTIYFSYFPPFSNERHLSLISKCSKYHGACQVQSLGQSLDGREIECISLGEGDTTCWIIHRQHPGETMAEYYAEGLLTRLLGLDTNGQVDIDDPVVKDILTKFKFYIVPCMCPDGAVRGHLRTNACGANLNREWATKGNYEAPTLHRSPEVFSVLKKMDETGVDMFLDIHGDEELPYNFISGAEHCPTWGPRLQSLHGAFTAAYTRMNSDMQQDIGYPPPDSPESVLEYLNVASNQVATRFDCLALTLEMPFKDCASNPDPERGWSPARSRKLGASVLEPLLYIHPHLRAKGEFWTTFSSQDAYVQPTDKYEEEGFIPIKKEKRFYSDVRAFMPQTK
jgi:murein tripeptide amidase MpaA|uniref:Peptidase M14 domain-containing protein n=1 Tax=Attheya septentrionalis TaxID=420275 RepID=A0A6T7JN58_9STRA|mmetsp:Transcript_5679/g.10012  ORF Transcript_5679/g.10012 Transcript_5679/m.10012 type:complete len:461 (+) Transcript_5679:192-1574(+)